MKHEIPLILKQGGGAIVNTSSGAGVIGIKGSPAYTAAKHGVIGLTRAAALDYAAQKAGKIRFIGFTGHKDPRVHLRMHEVAVQHRFRFDAEQLPLNVMDAHFRSFERDVLPVLNRADIAPLGMKAFGHPYILHSNTVTPIEALHYCLNLPIAVQITGIDSQQL